MFSYESSDMDWLGSGIFRSRKAYVWNLELWTQRRLNDNCAPFPRILEISTDIRATGLKALESRKNDSAS